GTIYIAAAAVVGRNQSGNVYAVNSNGSKKWQFANVLLGYLASVAIGADGTIYFNSAQGILYALSPDGTQKWMFTIGTPSGSSPAIGSDGTNYVGNGVGFLFAVNPDGTHQWGYQLTNSIQLNSPSIGADGTIYISD